MDRLTAVEQSIYVEVELSQLMKSFALDLYQSPQAQDFWKAMSRAHCNQVVALEYEKWRIVREEIDRARILYDEPGLLKEIARFDELRGSVVRPLQFKQSLELGAKAIGLAMRFHEERILMADFGVDAEVVRAIVESGEKRRDTMASLASAGDPLSTLAEIDLESLQSEPGE